MTVLANLIAILVAAGIIYVGVSYVLVPQTMAPSFGLRTLPTNGDAFYDIKGVRDIASGVVVLLFLLLGSAHSVGLVLLAEALIPLGDMAIILGHRGSVRTALGVHGMTALAMVLSAVLLIS